MTLTKRPSCPRYLNIGAGKWSHPLWHNLDNPRDDYQKSLGANDFKHDLMSSAPLPFVSNTLDIVYTSHTIEHLNDAAAARLFGEVWRCLRPGGVFRVTCPDTELAYRRYLAGDKVFWHPFENKYTLEQLFVSTFATAITEIMPEANTVKITDEYVREVFRSEPMEYGLNVVTGLISEDIVRKYPQSHNTWFTVEKLIELLKRAGFTALQRSAYGQSRALSLRDLNYFDSTRPDISLYVECTKP